LAYDKSIFVINFGKMKQNVTNENKNKKEAKSEMK